MTTNIITNITWSVIVVDTARIQVGQQWPDVSHTQLRHDVSSTPGSTTVYNCIHDSRYVFASVCLLVGCLSVSVRLWQKVFFINLRYNFETIFITFLRIRICKCYMCIKVQEVYFSWSCTLNRLFARLISTRWGIITGPPWFLLYSLWTNRQQLIKFSRNVW